MDPNAEQPPPTVQVTEVEVDFGLRVGSTTSSQIQRS